MSIFSRRNFLKSTGALAGYTLLDGSRLDGSRAASHTDPANAASAANMNLETIPGCHKLPPASVLANIRHIVFDLDGTVYKGGDLFPYTKPAFDLVEKCGLSYTYLTNNSSLSVKDYVEKIRRLDLKGDTNNVFTSSLATLSYLKKNHPDLKTLFLLGTESLKEEFREAGYRLLSHEEDGEPDAVVVAFDTSLSYEPFCKATWWVKQGKPYFATHPDMVCPTDRPTVLLDCGAIVDCIASVTKRRPDKIPGKPDPAMLEGIMEKHGLKPQEIAMVGDRLYTDIKMAELAKAVGVLVLSGEATLEDLRQSPLEPEVVVDNIFVFTQCVEVARKQK